MRSIPFVVLLAVAYAPRAFAADDLKTFLPAEEGMTRHIIRLPTEKDEAALKVEVIIGKTVRTDAENRYFFGGVLEKESIPGWGFDRYILVSFRGRA